MKKKVHCVSSKAACSLTVVKPLKNLKTSEMLLLDVWPIAVQKSQWEKLLICESSEVAVLISIALRSK